MAKWRLSVAVACVAAALAPAQALARQGIPGVDHAWSEKSERVDKDHWKLTGDVEIQRDDVKFFADEVDIFTDVHMLHAKGNVLFTNGTTRIAADTAEFDYETKLGVFYHADGVVTKGAAEGQAPSLMTGPAEPEVYFRGEILEKIGDRRYKITRGGFTTCLQPTPRWELTSGSVTISVDHYALLTNSLFKVKGVPVMYLPVVYYPINKEGRSTGFLMPMYGTSTFRGFTLSNAFFWAISRSQDLTLLHDWFTKTGQGFGSSYRYVASPTSNGNLKFYRLSEKATTSSLNGVETTTAAKRSMSLNGSLNQALPLGLRARGQVDYFTDVTVQQTYNTNISATSNREPSFGGNISGAWGEYSTNLNFDYRKHIFDAANSTLNGTLPRLSLTKNDRPLFGSPVYFRVAGEYVSVLRKTIKDGAKIDFGLSRFDVSPAIRVPFNSWQFLTINSAVSLHYTHWDQSRDPVTTLQVKTPISRTYGDILVRIVGPVIYRIWNLNGGYAEKLKHTIEPFVDIQRVGAIDNFDRIVQLDSIDGVIGKATRLSYGLTSRLYAKRKIGDAPARAMEIVSLSVSQSYYSDAVLAQYDAAYQSSFGKAPPSRLSALSLGLRATPFESLNASVRAEYNTKFRAIQTMSAQGSWRGGENLNLNVGWSLRRYIPGLSGFDNPLGASQSLTADTSVRFAGNRFGGTASINYDVGHKLFLQQRFVGYYNAQCCGFGIEYQNFSFAGISSSPVTQDRRFNFTITLAGLGSFGNNFGSGGGLGGGSSTIR